MVLQETYAIEDLILYPKLDGTEQLTQISGTTTVSNGEMSGGSSYLTNGFSNTGNWRCTLQFKASNNNCAMIIIKDGETAVNMNQLLVHTQEIAVSVNGTTTRTTGLPSSYNTWYDLEIVKNGSDITVTMGTVTKTVSWSLAETLNSLCVGLQTWNGTSTIRNIKVKAL